MSGRPNYVASALAGAGCIFLLGACAELEGTTGDLFSGTTTVAYDCDDDREFTASFSADRDWVRVRTEDDSFTLGLTDRDGDQFQYSDEDGDAQLTVEDSAAELDLDDADNFEDCEAEIT